MRICLWENEAKKFSGQIGDKVALRCFLLSEFNAVNYLSPALYPTGGRYYIDPLLLSKPSSSVESEVDPILVKTCSQKSVHSACAYTDFLGGKSEVVPGQIQAIELDAKAEEGDLVSGLISENGTIRAQLKVLEDKISALEYTISVKDLELKKAQEAKANLESKVSELEVSKHEQVKISLILSGIIDMQTKLDVLVDKSCQSNDLPQAKRGPGRPPKK